MVGADFCRVQRKKIYFYHRSIQILSGLCITIIKTLRQIDENGKKQYEFEIIKSRSVSIRKGLFSEMIKESIERYHRKKTIQENIESKAKFKFRNTLITRAFLFLNFLKKSFLLFYCFIVLLFYRLLAAY